MACSDVQEVLGVVYITVGVQLLCLRN